MSGEKKEESLAGILADDIKRRGQITEEGIELQGINTKKKLKWNEGERYEGEREYKKQLRAKFIDKTTGDNKNYGEATEILSNYLTSEYNIYTTKNDKKSETWIYKNGIYTPEGKSELKKILRDILEDRYNIWIFNKVFNKIEADTFIDEKDFFKQHYKERIPVQNGILNITEKELEPFNSSKIFFNKINAKYNPEAKCPMIDKFLEDVLKDEEDKKVFYEIVGYCLIKEYKFEKAFMFLGDGRNGKDKSMELIKRLLNPDNCCSVDIEDLENDEWSTFELFGNLVSLAGEISGKDLKEATNFKKATGRSVLSGKRKFKSTINFVNYCKFIFACNELPMVYESTRAFWDRWVLLQFPYTFVKREEYEERKDEEYIKLRDEDIIKKITTNEEMSGLLNKALDGLDRLLENRDFSYTPGSKEVKEFWIRKANSFMAFCMDRIDEAPESYVTKKELRREYKKYCKKHNVKGRGDKAIKAALQEEFGVIESRKTIPMSGNQKRVWEGIKIREKKKNKVKIAIKKLENKYGKMVDTDVLMDELDEEISADEINNSLIKLKKSGEIFFPREGYIQRIKSST